MKHTQPSKQYNDLFSCVSSDLLPSCYNSKEVCKSFLVLFATDLSSFSTECDYSKIRLYRFISMYSQNYCVKSKREI